MKESKLGFKIMEKSQSNIKKFSKQSESFIKCNKQTLTKESSNPIKVSYLGFKIMKKLRSNIKRRSSVIHSKDYHAPKIYNEEKERFMCKLQQDP